MAKKVRYNMGMQASAPSVLKENASSIAVFEALLAKLAEIGPFEIEEKKTSLHITNSRAAFLGVHPRREGLRLNIVLPYEIESERVAKAEQVSAKRWHNEVDVKEASQLDSELLDWILQAYQR